MINISKPSKIQKPYIYRNQIISTGKLYIGKTNGNYLNYKGSGVEYLKDFKIYVKKTKLDLVEEILEYVDDVSILGEREKYWLEYFNAANNPLYYNLTNKSTGPQTHTKETISRILESRSKNPVYRKPRNILQYDYEGNFIKEWVSAKEASFNICGEYKPTYIRACCNNEHPTTSCWGYMWRYKDGDIINNIEPFEKYKSMFGPNYQIRKSLTQYDLEGNIIRVWDGIISIVNELGLKSQSISACCCGKNKTHKGFMWKYN